MKRILVTLSLMFGLMTADLNAQEKMLINPVPQSVELSGKKIEKSQFISKIDGKWEAKKVLIGTKNEKKLRKFASKVPNKAEGYYIAITPKNIVVVGNDARGTYYGTQTLKQLMEQPMLPLGEIRDYPHLASRGVVEGFYGTPWSHEKRLRQIDFYGTHKLNVYIYGPKDDPYHSSPNWRLPYPEKEAQQVKELVQRANANFVDFVWAIHPGQDIKWNDEDRKKLIDKFEMMYQLGVRAFAVFFDDISGEGTNPQKQAELLNYLHNNFVAKKKDVKPLIMCPTEYNKSWSNPEKKYLETLGNMLHPSIEIMWTGDRVVADVDKQSMAWINDKIKRKAYIWWNFPVSDYVRDHLLLGPAYGNGLDIKDDMSGFVSNPMEHPEASKIAIYSVANYTWNLEKYNSDATWKSAIADIMPKNKEALLTFAKHNSDLGVNGHRYRRDESVEFRPVAQDFLKNFDKGLQNPQLSEVKSEFKEMILASKTLLKTDENKYFTEEIKPWVLQFGLVGAMGEEVMTMYEALAKNNPSDFKNAYAKVQMIQKQMFENDQTLNQNPYQPGVKTATLVVEPLINQSLEKMVASFNQKYNESLKLSTNFNPNQLKSNISQLKSVALLQRGKSVRISPVLEFISMKKDHYFGIELEKISTVKSIAVDLGKADLFSKVKVQISTNGKDWQTIEGSIANSRWTSSSAYNGVKAVRVLSPSSEEFQFQMKQFEIVLE